MADQKRLFKITVFLRRKEGMTAEEFHHHWTTVHPPIVTPWFQKYGIVRYVQYFLPSSVAIRDENELELTGPLSSKMLDCDGYVDLVMPSPKCFIDAIKDPYYEEYVKPDEDKFLDPNGIKYVVGYEEQKF